MNEDATSGRRRAGEDPAKRSQILKGAYRVFMERGFDAASMNDITRAAGVSKGTIYVYFRNKEELFEALVDDERLRLTAGLYEALAAPDFETALRRFLVALVGLATSNEAVRAQRTVIAIAERMPALGARFIEEGTGKAEAALAAFLTARAGDAGLEIRDARAAAESLVTLAIGTILRRRLYGADAAEPDGKTIAATAERALAAFLAAARAGVW